MRRLHGFDAEGAADLRKRSVSGQCPEEEWRTSSAKKQSRTTTLRRAQAIHELSSHRGRERRMSFPRGPETERCACNARECLTKSAKTVHGARAKFALSPFGLGLLCFEHFRSKLLASSSGLSFLVPSRREPKARRPLALQVRGGAQLRQGRGED